MLARRPYSVAELRRALGKKFPGSPDIPTAIVRLRTLGYLDDRKFAEQYASSLARHRAFGPHRIRRELKAKLVDYKFIEPALARAFEETDEIALLERTLTKKIRATRPPFTPAKLHSLCQGLMRRGFSAGDIMKAIRGRPELKPIAEEANPLDLEASEGEF
jgi:regulatory protein